MTLTVVLGGVAFGIGAWMNGACALGTLAHLIGGKALFEAGLVIFKAHEGHATMMVEKLN